MGHTMAACGGIETVMMLYMMQDGFIAPTLHSEDIDERCAMVRHVQKPVDQKVNTAIQNFAFGGVNTSLLIRKLTRYPMAMFQPASRIINFCLTVFLWAYFLFGLSGLTAHLLCYLIILAAMALLRRCRN